MSAPGARLIWVRSASRRRGPGLSDVGQSGLCHPSITHIQPHRYLDQVATETAIVVAIF